jgi:hypothetical protein
VERRFQQDDHDAYSILHVLQLGFSRAKNSKKFGVPRPGKVRRVLKPQGKDDSEKKQKKIEKQKTKQEKKKSKKNQNYFTRCGD